jgi:3-oxoacyl-[acyl-carrier-protein] synthase II
MSQRRVVVTGMGIVSPVGNTLASAWDNIRNGRSGIGRITHFDPSAYTAQIAGEVRDFDVKSIVPPSRSRRWTIPGWRSPKRMPSASAR